MTAREAVNQARLELGQSREEVELGAKYADGIIPDAVPLTECPVRAGHEREFIEYLKQLFRCMRAHPQATQAWFKSKMAKRTAAN
jgi:hypothetical protein